MRAMVMPRFGGPELFEEGDVGRPKPGPGEVLVRVVVAGTNPVGAKLRADGAFAGLEPPVVLGSDVSGVDLWKACSTKPSGAPTGTWIPPACPMEWVVA